MNDPPLLIAHRGASHAAPENTLEAFHLGLAEGAHGLELDVRLSADGQPVVFHDAELERLTGTPGQLGATPWSSISELVVMASTGQGRGRVPHLSVIADLARAFPERIFNIELKALPRPDLLVAAARPHLELIGHHAPLVISSFDPRVLALLSRAPLVAPHRLALLFDDPSALSALRFLPEAIDLHPHASLLTQATFAAWSAPDRRLRAWTVDDPEEARRLLALDPSIALITNRPGHLLAELTRHARPH